MMTFVLAAAVLVSVLCVAVALEGATTEAPTRAVTHVLAARLLATDHTVPVALSGRRREPVAFKGGRRRAFTVREAELAPRVAAVKLNWPAGVALAEGKNAGPDAFSPSHY